MLCGRFWLKFAPGISLLSLSATRRPVKAWQWVSNTPKDRHIFHNSPRCNVSRHKKNDTTLPADENKRVTRLCEVQDGSSSVSVCGLGLAPSSLNPLLRALKLQASLTELRLSGNRLNDNLLPELVATTITMPRLRLLDISACHVTGEGLEKAVNALKGQSHPAFPVKSPAGQVCCYFTC